MNAYYLNNSVTICYDDDRGKEFVKITCDQLPQVFYDIIYELEEGRRAHGAEFNASDYFYAILYNIGEGLAQKNVSAVIVKVILKILMSNKEAIIQLSGLDIRYDIKMIDGKLLVIGF